MDNVTEFAGSLVQLYKGLGIVYHHITIINSKANRQVEKIIWILKEYHLIWLAKGANHLALAPLLMCMIASHMIDIAPYL